MKEQINNGILEEIPDDHDTTINDNRVVYYMPHHAVLKEERATTKLRIVYDASSRQGDSQSLNDCLMSGPNLNPDLLEILLRFRSYRVAFTADITKAFLQIKLREKDRDAVRLLWYDECPLGVDEPKLKKLRLTRVLFGATSSPFLLTATIKYHLQKYENSEPNVCHLLNNDLYVDDFISGADTVNEASEIKSKSKIILAEAGMELSKWTSNEPILNDEIIPETERADCNDYTKNMSKVLGMSWQRDRDEFLFTLDKLLKFVAKNQETKRFVLQTSARIFDPAGFLTPFTVRIKYLIQELWSRGMKWDDPIPVDLRRSWIKWCSELTLVSEITIPRFYFGENSLTELETLELHVFSDASEKAYGSAAYLRFTNKRGSIDTTLVCGRSRIAPLKKMSLPRLELMGALVAARLATFLLRSLPNLKNIYLWTDSTITLYWIRGRSDRWKPFVSNRVNEIQSKTNPQNWSYCASQENPADLVTRGESAEGLKANKLWRRDPAG